MKTPRMTLCFFLFALSLSALAFADDPAAAARPKPKREPGVRLRLFRVAAPMHRLVSLAEGQSPNIDRTIDSLQLAGDEDFIDDHRRYVAILTAQLEISKKGQQRFLFKTDAPAELRIDGKVVAQCAPPERSRKVQVELAAGKHDVEVIVAVDGALPKLKVSWASPGQDEFTSLDKDSLTAEAFYFRPTAPGMKRLVQQTDRPGRGKKVVGVYPGLDLMTIHPADVDVPVGGLAMLDDDTLVVATFDARRLKAPKPQAEADGELWLYHNARSDDLASIRRERIASGLFEPAGVCVADGAIYVSQRDEVTRFDRHESAGKWEPTTVASGWVSNDFHAISFGLVHEKVPGEHPGYLYLGRGTGLGLQQNPPNHGSVWRIDLSRKAGDNVEPITGGHRTPNGLGWGADGALYVTDNQGEFTPANELNRVRDGAFYGFYQRVGEKGSPSPFQPDATRRSNPSAVTEAVAWLPQDEIGNSPTQPLLIPKTWPFAGQMFVADMKYGGINRVYLEEVDGVWQGVAMRFTQGMEGGINRLAISPSGALYAGAIGGDHASTWNWVDPAGRKTYQGLQRLTPNGRTVMDFDRIEAQPDGFLLHFTKPVANAWLARATNYKLQQWTYKATGNYGGPKLEVEKLKVDEAEPNADGRSVRLRVPGLKPNRVVHFVVDPVATDGEEIWSAEAWYTLRQIPSDSADGDLAKDASPPHVVFVTGDDEYGSELSMPMIASILEKHHGFRVTVLRSVDEQGNRDRHGHSIPGLRALRDADLAVFFLRFRKLPGWQLNEILSYVNSSKPVIGLRTSTHAFRYPEEPLAKHNNGFGDQVWGQHWISHYGHGSTSTSTVRSDAAEHPILRGVPKEFDLRSWLYVMNRGKDALPDDCNLLIDGDAIAGENDRESAVLGERFGKRQPIAWTRELLRVDGQTQRIFYTSLGHPRDFEQLPARRLLVNAIYWAVGRENDIPAGGTKTPLPPEYRPTDPK